MGIMKFLENSLALISRGKSCLYIFGCIYIYIIFFLSFFFLGIFQGTCLCSHIKEGAPTTFDYTTYITVIVKRTVVVRAKQGEWKP